MAQDNTADVNGQDMPDQADQPNDRGQNRQEQQGGEKRPAQGGGSSAPQDNKATDQQGASPAVER